MEPYDVNPFMGPEDQPPSWYVVVLLFVATIAAILLLLLSSAKSEKGDRVLNLRNQPFSAGEVIPVPRPRPKIEYRVHPKCWPLWRARIGIC